MLPCGGYLISIAYCLFLFLLVILNNAMAFVNMHIFFTFYILISLLLLTVTLRGVSNKHCLLSLFSFCISSCSGTPLVKCDLVFFYNPKVLRSTTKLLRIGSQNFMPKNDLDHIFCMYKGGNPKVFKSKF